MYYVYLLIATVHLTPLVPALFSAQNSIIGTLDVLDTGSWMQFIRKAHLDEVEGRSVANLSLVGCVDMGFIGGTTLWGHEMQVDYRRSKTLAVESVKCDGTERSIQLCKRAESKNVVGYQKQSALVIKCCKSLNVLNSCYYGL